MRLFRTIVFSAYIIAILAALSYGNRWIQKNYKYTDQTIEYSLLGTTAIAAVFFYKTAIYTAAFCLTSYFSHSWFVALFTSNGYSTGFNPDFSSQFRTNSSDEFIARYFFTMCFSGILGLIGVYTVKSAIDEDKMYKKDAKSDSKATTTLAKAHSTGIPGLRDSDDLQRVRTMRVETASGALLQALQVTGTDANGLPVHVNMSSLTAADGHGLTREDVLAAMSPTLSFSTTGADGGGGDVLLDDAILDKTLPPEDSRPRITYG